MRCETRPVKYLLLPKLTSRSAPAAAHAILGSSDQLS